MHTSYQLEIIRSRRKTLALQISAPGVVTVRAPLRAPRPAIDAFLLQHREWIDRHLQAAVERQRAQAALPPLPADALRSLARQAAADLAVRTARWAALAGVSYGRITVRCQKTRWGSCSAQGNLNFNCLLMLCPAEVVDYVVVHELCHRKEMNHSARFWAQVEQLLPEYRAARQWLRQHGPQLMARAQSAPAEA